MPPVAPEVVEALRWAAGSWLLWYIPTPESVQGTGHQDSDSAVRSVSVIIPARDEAASLPALLASLEPGGEAETVVVDDHSTDSTAALAAAAGATVIAAPPLPAGWLGKPHACAVGAAATSGTVMVFLDADTTLEPGGLARLVDEQARRGGLVSVQPWHRVQRPYEHLSAFCNVVAMMGVGTFTPLGRRRPPTGAFGPAMVCSRADYAATGGHAAVRDEVVEDIALGRRFVSAGLSARALGGKGTIAFRMYPGGLRQLLDGWTKNMAAGAGSTSIPVLLLVIAWLSGCLQAAWRLPTGGADAVAVYAVYAAQLWWMFRRVGSFHLLTAILYPVPLMAFLAIFLRSLSRSLQRKDVPWKGRPVPARKHP